MLGKLTGALWPLVVQSANIQSQGSVCFPPASLFLQGPTHLWCGPPGSLPSCTPPPPGVRLLAATGPVNQIRMGVACVMSHAFRDTGGGVNQGRRIGLKGVCLIITPL